MSRDASGGDTARPTWDQLDAVLSGRRRRQVLERLARDGGPVPVSRLATAVAVREYDADPGELTSSHRSTVAADLRGEQLPRLHRARLVRWDRDEDRVSLTEYATSLPLFGPDGRVHQV